MERASVKVLRIDELMDQICHELLTSKARYGAASGPHDLTRLACVSKHVSAVALRCLWDCVPLRALVYVLPLEVQYVEQDEVIVRLISPVQMEVH